MLFQQGDAIQSMFLILSGEARLERLQASGGMAVLQRARAGSFLAEASLFSAHYHCSAVAATDVVAKLVPRRAMRQLFDIDRSFAAQWASHLASEVRQARLRAEILSLKRVSDRIDAWIAHHGLPDGHGALKALALEIAVTPEALYRVMARRRVRHSARTQVP
jgi:CRP-like cAMP-binding protein